MHTKRIVNVVAKAFRVKPEEMLGRSRPQRVADARQMAMLVISQLHGATLEKIGACFGRDYSTVSYTLREIQNKIDLEPKTKQRFDAIMERLGKV